MFGENPFMKIGLGTAQFGLDYGVSNREGITPETEVADILEYAWESGITILDTAVSYGGSEDVLGRCIPKGVSFKIVTKTPVIKKDSIDKADAARLKDAFRKSLEKLKQPNLFGLLIHHANDLLRTGSQFLWEAMQDLKAEGLVQKIGVSVYSPLESEELLNRYSLDLVQLPLNVFGQRMIQNGHLQHLKSRGIEIHSRSVFLQGLLLMLPDELPIHFNAIRPLVKKYREDLNIQGISPLKAALSFVYRQTEIDCIIIGVNNQKHLQEIMEAVSKTDDLDKINFPEYAVMDEAIINPSLWNIPS
jgi:aryl-alcohol dehydrogenase-like predicted oxidoreductase